MLLCVAPAGWELGHPGAAPQTSLPGATPGGLGTWWSVPLSAPSSLQRLIPSTMSELQILYVSTIVSTVGDVKTKLLDPRLCHSRKLVCRSNLINEERAVDTCYLEILRDNRKS